MAATARAPPTRQAVRPEAGQPGSPEEFMGQSTRTGFWSTAELYLGVAGLSVAAVIFLVSEAYPDIAWEMGGPPAFYPRFVAALFALLAMIVLVEGFFHPTRVKWPPANTAMRLAAGGSVLALAPLGIGTLGFLPTGFCVSLIIMAALVEWEGLSLRRGAYMIVMAALCTALLFMLFRYLAGVRLPGATLPF